MMLHDCIEDMPEPLYGFVTNLTLVQDELCELDVTCTSNGTKIRGDIGEGSLPPQGNQHQTTSRNRIQPRYYAPTKIFYPPQHQTVDRQTGEEFASSGPPRCRARRARTNNCRINNQG